MSDAEAAYGISPPGIRLPSTTRPGPVRLRVADLDRSLAFYRRVLGLVEVDTDWDAGLAPEGAGEALVHLVERPGARPVTPSGRLGLFHYALLVPDRTCLARFVLRLREVGVRAGMSDHHVSEAVYLSDPDGLGIEVYADRPRSQWRTRGRQLFMTTEPLDLDDLLREAGAEDGPGVHRRPGAPAAEPAPDVDGALPAGTRVGHVHLHVADMTAAAAFYHDTLGFDKVVWDYPGALFMSAGGYHHHVGINTWAKGAPPPAEDDARLLAWTLLLPGAASVEALAGRASAAGYPVVRGADGVVVEDPWGTAVEVRSQPPSRS